MSNPGAKWASVNIDPTAGVSLMPRVVRCPRCDVVKGRAASARPGLCHDCVSVLTKDEARAWRAAA